MPNRSIIDILVTLLTLETVSDTAAAQTSAAVDGFGCDAVTHNLHIGASLVAGGTYKITECDTSGGTYTDAAATDMVGTGITPVASKTIRVGYIGRKRYSKLVFTPGGATDVTMTATLGRLDNSPRANPS